MGAPALGQYARQAFSASVHLAAADDAKQPRLRRSSPAVSPHPDSVHVVSRSADGSEGRRGFVRQPGRLFLLLAGGALRNSLPPSLVAGAACFFSAVFVSAEHDEGAAFRD